MKETSRVHKLYYQHPGTWFGDCMPIFADGAYQLSTSATPGGRSVR